MLIILHQANIMMLGEMLCMLVYLLYSRLSSTSTSVSDDEAPRPNMFLFLPPALCDVIATSMMYIGLTLTSASQFQMLRGSIMIFVGILSKLILKKQLEWFRWAGMGVIFIGIMMVGAADFFHGGEQSGVSDAIIGDIIVVCAQVEMRKYFYFHCLQIHSSVDCRVSVCVRGEVHLQVQCQPSEGGG